MTALSRLMSSVPLDAYWRACNHLALGMLYLRDKMRTVGHVATFMPRFYRPAWPIRGPERDLHRDREGVSL